jgi:DNA-binding transcriptional MerR regulator
MGIKEATHQAGVNVQTIRHYEQGGLLPALPRWTSGYRERPLPNVRRLRLKNRAQDLGVSLDDPMGDAL